MQQYRQSKFPHTPTGEIRFGEVTSSPQQQLCVCPYCLNGKFLLEVFSTCTNKQKTLNCNWINEKLKQCFYRLVLYWTEHDSLEQKQPGNIWCLCVHSHATTELRGGGGGEVNKLHSQWLWIFELNKLFESAKRFVISTSILTHTLEHFGLETPLPQQWPFMCL